MSPSINNNSIVFIDTERLEIKNEGAVYAFQQGDKTKIKIFGFGMNGYVLKNTNANYSDEEISFDEFSKSTQVIGQVVGCMNKFK